MGRKTKFFGAPKPIAAAVAQTITFSSSEIDSTGVVQYMCAMQPAGNTVATIDRVRLRAGSQVLIELTQAQLLAFQTAYSKANFFDATTSNAFIIPLNLMDAPTPDAADACQFPPGSEAQLEIVFLATVVAGTIIVGWTLSDVKPRFFPRCYTRTGNIPVSTRNAPFSFSDSGIIRGIGFDIRGLDRVELTVSGQASFLMPGAAFQGLVYGNMLDEKDVLNFGLGTTALNYRFHNVENNLPAANGSSNLILDTQAAWPGTTSEIALYVVDELVNFRG